MSIIGIDLQEEPGAVEAFGKGLGIPFPLAVESEDRVKKLFGLPSGCPSTVLIDRKGQIVGRILGARDWASDAARGLLRALLEGAGPGIAKGSPPVAGAPQLRKSVHLVSAVRPNDPKLTEILDEGAVSLAAGDEVVILFDGQSVGALRMRARNETETLLGAELASKERRALARRLGMPESDAPRSQLGYVQYLARRGAKVFVNRSAVRLLGLSKDEIHPIARPIYLRQLEKMVDDSDGCYTYSHD